VRASPALVAVLLPGVALSAADTDQLEANALHPYAGVVSSEVKAHPLPEHPSGEPVHQGKIVVTPDNEDLSPAPKDRWERFAEALGPGRTALSRHRTYGWRNNDGTRMECIAPCIVNCCVRSGGLPVVGQSGL